MNQGIYCPASHTVLSNENTELRRHCKILNKILSPAVIKALYLTTKQCHRYNDLQQGLQ